MIKITATNRSRNSKNSILFPFENDYQRDMRWGDSIRNMEQWFALRQKPEKFSNYLSFRLLRLIKETIEKGYDIVNSYHIYTYLDYDYESIPLQKSYEFNLIPEGLTEAQQSKVFGIGCQMWGEFIPTVESMNKKIYPRLAAYAEVGWTNPSNKDFDRFRNSLNSFIGHWEKLGIQLGEWK